MSVHDFPGKRKPISENNGAVAGGGNPPYDGIMEARVAKLESTTEYIQRDIKELKEDVRGIRKDMSIDFRLTWGGIIALGLGLAALLAKGFHWI